MFIAPMSILSTFIPKNTGYDLYPSCLYEGSCLIYVMCVWVRFSGVGHVLCCVFLRIVFPLLPVSLDCPFFIAVRYSLTFISIILLFFRGGQLYWL